MTHNELREMIAKEVYEGYTGLPWPPFDDDKDDHIKNSAYKHADSILSLLTNELEKARLWDMVMEVFHKDNESFVQYANTISKIREIESEGNKNHDI